MWMCERNCWFLQNVLCESLKNLISKLEKNNSDVKKYELKLKKHIFASRIMQKLTPYLEVRFCVI